MFEAMLDKHIPLCGHLRYSDHNITSTIRTGQESEVQQADRFSFTVHYQQVPPGQVDHLGHQGRGGGALVLPGWWQNTLGLVVPSKPVDSAFNQNQTELSILILPVTFKMLSDRYSLLDQVVAVLGQFRSHALSLQDTKDLVASDKADLSYSMTVPEDDTNLGGCEALLSKLENLVLNLVRCQFQPLWD